MVAANVGNSGRVSPKRTRRFGLLRVSAVLLCSHFGTQLLWIHFVSILLGAVLEDLLMKDDSHEPVSLVVVDAFDYSARWA